MPTEAGVYVDREREEKLPVSGVGRCRGGHVAANLVRSVATAQLCWCRHISGLQQVRLHRNDAEHQTGEAALNSKAYFPFLSSPNAIAALPAAVSPCRELHLPFNILLLAPPILLQIKLIPVPRLQEDPQLCLVL